MIVITNHTIQDIVAIRDVLVEGRCTALVFGTASTSLLLSALYKFSEESGNEGCDAALDTILRDDFSTLSENLRQTALSEYNFALSWKELRYLQYMIMEWCFVNHPQHVLQITRTLMTYENHVCLPKIRKIVYDIVTKFPN